MKTGELIRKYRKMRGMTQSELAELCDLSDSGIRNYELGNRTPSDKHLDAIAQALSVSQAALREVPLESARQALEYLFRIDEELGLRPQRDEDGNVVLSVEKQSPKAPKLDAVLEAWMRQVEKLESGEVSQEEYEAWKAEIR